MKTKDTDLCPGPEKVSMYRGVDKETNEDVLQTVQEVKRILDSLGSPAAQAQRDRIHLETQISTVICVVTR